MDHRDFVTGYSDGRIQVRVDREAAARLVSGRMMLPLVLLPFLGLAVALAIVGYWIVGAVIFLAALALRYAVRSSAQGFVLSRCLNDPRFYEEAVRTGVVSVTPA
jgi:hypothetical protein